MNMNDDIKKVLVTEEQIRQRCKELAKEIDEYYVDKFPIVLNLLKGSVPFSTMLTSYMTIKLEFDYMKASSYAGTNSTGNVALKILPSANLTGRHILIVEDIIDTGLTLSTVVKILQEYQPASIEIVTLLDKPYLRKVNDIVPKWNGFQVPNEFVVGFGLDYNELYRQLPYVGVLKEEVYSK